MYLPQQSAVASKWAVWDYAIKTVYSPAASGGAAQLSLPTVPDNELWFVDRARISTNSTSATFLYLYDSIVDDDHAIDGSYSGEFDVADNASPILLLPTTTLIARWVGASAGSIGRMRAQLTIMRRPDGN